MFLVFEAEEDCSPGAFHYVDHPIVPLDRTVAVLNMDMIGRDEESPTWNTKAADNRNGVNVIGTLYSRDLRAAIERQNKSDRPDARLQDRQRRSRRVVLAQRSLSVCDQGRADGAVQHR